MWQVARDAARMAGRFARRHRRAIVVGGVVGAAACVFHSMKKALEEAEKEHEALVRRTADEARYRQCLSRTRVESVAALANFLPALRKRLFLAVDVTGPVRELKALRGTGAGGGGRAAGAGTGAGAAGQLAESGRGGGVGGGGGSSSSGGGTAVADGSTPAVVVDVESREVELWEQVKVTALTRLVVSLYACNALALMLHMQLHILGRLSFEESQHLLQTNITTTATTPDVTASSSTTYPSSSSIPGATTPPGIPATAAGAGVGDAGAAPAAAGVGGSGVGVGAGVGGGGAGVALSMEARHALLSSTYEYVLGNGLRELVRDVERAVSRCTCSWRAHTRQEVGFKDLVAVLRRVRREIEGPIGGADYDADFDGGYGSGGLGGGGGGEGGGWGGGRSPIVRRSLLLRYIINPSDGIDGEAALFTSAPAREAPGTAAFQEATPFGGSNEALRGLQGVGDVLDETWDTAESPNFAAALQSCLDTTFAMVYEQLRQKAFGRGGGGRRQPRGVVGGSGGGGGGISAGTAAEGGGSGGGGSEGPGGGRAVGPMEEAMAGERTASIPEEREDFAQVLATVISQAKLIVSEILEPSPRNGYSQAVAALPSVQDLCSAVFGIDRDRINRDFEPAASPCFDAAAAHAAVAAATATLSSSASSSPAPAGVLGSTGRLRSGDGGGGSGGDGGGGSGGGGGGAADR